MKTGLSWTHRLVLGVMTALMLFALAPTVFGQSTAATLSGTVMDPAGAVVPNVKIIVRNVNTNFRRDVTTNKDGYFTVPQLDPGKYSVQAMREGFAVVEVPDVVLNTADRKELQIKLKVGSKTESIVVSADTASVSVSPTVSTVIDRKFLQDMPLNGRTFQSLLLMTPGVTSTAGAGQLSFNGQRSNANYFTVDGVSANIGVSTGTGAANKGTGHGYVSYDQNMTAGSIPGYNSVGGTNNLISVDALEEFKVQTSNYSAEYGRQPGGQVQMTSRGGQNAYHGTVFDYFRNDALDARNWFDSRVVNLQKPRLRQNDFGGTLGGHLIKDKTFFFFSYEGQRLATPISENKNNVPSAWLRNDPTISADVRKLLNVFPMPNGPDNTVRQWNAAQGKYIDVPNGSSIWYQNWSNTRNVDSYSLRVDHALNATTTLFGRINIAPSNSVSPGMVTKFTSEVNTYTYTVGATSMLSNRMSNEFRGNYSLNEGTSNTVGSNQWGGTPISTKDLMPVWGSENSTVGFSLPGQVSYGSVGPSVQNRTRQWNFTDNVSYALASHSLKFGVDYRYLFPKVATRDYALSFGFANVADLQSGLLSSVYTAQQDTVVSIYKNLSLYAQDTWKVNRKLTLDYGVRWEWNPAPVAKDPQVLYTLSGSMSDLSSLKLAPAGTPMYPTRWNSFAPRVGASYQLFSRSGWETVLRGGYGLFYDLGSGMSGIAAVQYPHQRSRNVSDPKHLQSINYPFRSDSVTRPPDAFNLDGTYSTQDFTLFDPDYTLPRTHQWNASLSQGLGSNQTLSVSYVGNAGRRLLRRYVYQFATGVNSANAKFPGSTINYTTNSGDKSDSSDYHSLQVQYQRRLSKGLQVLSNYTWAHSIDTGSSDFMPNDFVSSPTPKSMRGSADFDVRHSFNAAISYDLPRLKSETPALRWLGNILLNNWSTDLIGKVQSGSPFSVVYTSDTQTGGWNTWTYRADRVAGVPLWITDPKQPNGKKLNVDAFDFPAAALTQNPVNGNTGRNEFRNYAMAQLDLSLRREFKLVESAKLQFKADMFNILNHPNFGSITNILGYMYYGYGSKDKNAFGAPSGIQAGSSSGAAGGVSSMYAIGGPRSVQFSAKIIF